MDETKNMWPHMNKARINPEALCARSRRAGQRLDWARWARPAPAMMAVSLGMSEGSDEPAGEYAQREGGREAQRARRERPAVGRALRRHRHVTAHEHHADHAQVEVDPDVAA